MAINKKLIHFKNFSDFNSKKLSANENNTQYTLGINGAVINGSPDILYQSICYIKDTKQQWTHGQLYDGGSSYANVQAVDTGDVLDDVNGNTYIKYVAQTLTEEQKAQVRTNIDAVSEHGIKTINGESILGSGDITISGGGSSSGGAYSEINHGTSDTVLTLAPNTFHIWDEVESLQLVYARPTAGIANEYLFQFTSGATATTLYLPDSIKWVGGSAPIIKPNMIYQISILNGLGSVLEFDNAPDLIENIGVYNEGSRKSGATLTFQYPVESDLTIYCSYASSDSFTLSKGNTTLNIDWYEPFAPQITGISPTSDNIYKYVI